MARFLRLRWPKGRFEVEPSGSAGSLLIISRIRTERILSMKTLKVALSFNRLPDGELSAFTNNVVTCMTGNASFAKSPVSMADLTKLLGTFDTATAAALAGGKALTAARQSARDELLAALRKIALYVQIAADGDTALLLASGFTAVNGSRSPQAKLEVPLILGVENEGTAKLTVRLQSVAHASAYEVRAVNGATTPASSMISASARRIVIGNLTPGTTYNISARAVGGSDGFSEWSDPVSHMAT
ncbi:MAG TPA: fibronectin type III domain-containing protein [Candidatus Acidoferrales bacterium]|nr:fibronectin type III domain-containing protein [Candidatus Acidoferrales bacterium]